MLTHSVQTSCTAHTHLVHLFNAPCCPCIGTYLRYLKYSHLETYSELGPLILETTSHWQCLMVPVHLTAEEDNLRWETGSILGQG